ncbi:MFS transporter [Paenarthrobacter sp. NPDC092416]|uniref:MFS transporter n=1 Tax=Paenarthrobacter sp. NPDC092416 TaxID=3364386 RepID=UPI0038223BB1
MSLPTSQDEIESAESTRSYRPSALVIFSLVAAVCVTAFESGMIYILLPRFGELFDVPASTTAWTVTAFMLVAATAALVGGRLGDMYGRKRVLIIVMLISALGSGISIFGDSMGAIIIGRGVQGVAGAIMPLCYGLAREALPRHKLGIGLGAMSGAGLVAGAGGSILAGRILDIWDWHVIFIFAGALAVIAAFIVAVSIPASKRFSQLPKFDLVGALLLTPGLTAVLYGLTQGPAWGWTSLPVVGLVASGVVVLAVWVRWELRQTDPLMNLRVLGDRRVSLTIVATSVMGLGPSGALVIVLPLIMLAPVTLAVGLGLSATAAGSFAAVTALVGFLISPLTGIVASKWGGRFTLVVGVSLYIVTCLIIFFGYNSIPAMVAAHITLAGAACFSLTAYPKLITESVPEEVTSEITGVMLTAGSMFAAIGVSIGSVILASSTTEGTPFPTLGAIQACLTLFIVCAVIVLGLVLAMGHSKVTPKAAEQSGAPELAEVE